MQATMEALVKHFGESVTVRFATQYDPCGESEVIGWIQHDGDVEKALDLLDAFCDEIDCGGFNIERRQSSGRGAP